MPGLGRSWEELYQALVGYRDVHGDCNVPQYYQADLALGQWVGKQRSRYAQRTNEDPKRRRLDALGFDWESQEERNERLWNDKFQRLVFYKAQHGHCRVPKAYKDDQELGNWVALQRILWKKKRLSQERHDKLESVQFSWVVSENKSPFTPASSKLEQKWMEKYHCLIRYKDHHGHCVVPKSFKEDGLGYWVNNVRAAHARGDLSATRKKLLDEIGFVWHIPRHAQKRRHPDEGSNDGPALKEQQMMMYLPADSSYGMSAHCTDP